MNNIYRRKIKKISLMIKIIKMKSIKLIKKIIEIYCIVKKGFKIFINFIYIDINHFLIKI